MYWVYMRKQCCRTHDNLGPARVTQVLRLCQWGFNSRISSEPPVVMLKKTMDFKGTDPLRQAASQKFMRARYGESRETDRLMRMGVNPVEGKTRGAMIFSFDAPPFRPVIRSLRL